jgi:hypothetical protein
MRAKLPKNDVSNGEHYRGKEIVNNLSIVVNTRNGLETPLSVRWYMGKSNSASVVYCSFWLNGKKRHIAGHGSAGGGGYHKESAAFQEAISSTGITLHGDVYGRKVTRAQCFIDGVGDRAMVDAALAMVRAFGYTGQHKIVR